VRKLLIYKVSSESSFSSVDLGVWRNELGILVIRSDNSRGEGEGRSFWRTITPDPPNFRTLSTNLI
jgi:hypothetical protein